MKVYNGIGLPIGVTVVVGFILNYILLPAWNLQSLGFWIYLMFLLLLFSWLISAVDDHYSGVLAKAITVSWVLFIVSIVLLLICLLIGSKLVNSKDYANILDGFITNETFESYEATVNNVPLLDKNSSMLIANRELGGLENVVSQFEIRDIEQITVNEKPVRVAILEYAGFFKWLNNRYDGTPGYIQVDMRTQNAELVRVEGGIKYSPSEYFSRNLKRYLRRNFPTLMFSQPTLELNEEGHPYWVAPIIEKTIGLFGGKDVSGAVIVDAVTGKIEKYKVGNIPEWIDNIYPSELMLEQYDNFGKYQSGFWNTIFGQKGVKVTTATTGGYNLGMSARIKFTRSGVMVTTEGYNYIPLDDDNWIYTGVTSVARDESNIGFVLMNKRTKETIYFPIAGAEEYSAMSSAEGAVQHLGYISTFPLLLRIEGQPTYLVALKDAGGLVKMYGMVNVEKYQIVATDETVEGCQRRYRELLRGSGTEISQLGTEPLEGKIEVIKEGIKDGATYIYLKLEGKPNYFSLSLLDSEEVILLEVGDVISMYVEGDSNLKIVPARLIE